VRPVSTARRSCRRRLPDGYTLLIPYHQHTVNAALLPKLPYHPVNDFTPITQMTAGGLLLVVNPSHPAKNAKDFVQWAKSTKDAVNFGSAGIGSGGHLAGELFKLMTSSKAQHIPYKGTGPAAIALIQGEYHYNFMGLTGRVCPGSRGQAARDRCQRAQAHQGRAPMFLRLPRCFQASRWWGWYGVVGPAKLPKTAADEDPCRGRELREVRGIWRHRREERLGSGYQLS
jgi:tripartite-type tricarboxylate transporter receptor subunit TctC